MQSSEDASARFLAQKGPVLPNLFVQRALLYYIGTNFGSLEQSLPPTVDGGRWGGRYRRRWEGRFVDGGRIKSKTLLFHTSEDPIINIHNKHP